MAEEIKVCQHEGCHYPGMECETLRGIFKKIKPKIADYDVTRVLA